DRDADRIGHGDQAGTGEVQARHLRASFGITSRHSGQTLVGAGRSPRGFKKSLVIMKITKAMMTKSTSVPRKLPYVIALPGVPSGFVVSTIFCSRHAPPGSPSPITGIRMSLTSEPTTFPIAPPITTPTASAKA